MPISHTHTHTLIQIHTHTQRQNVNYVELFVLTNISKNSHFQESPNGQKHIASKIIQKHFKLLQQQTRYVYE